MASREIRKAVVPAAGWGTRFLPATKAVPKEMLPLIDKPLIQYIVEEAVASGIEHIIVITASGKGAIENHFDRVAELEDLLEQKGEGELLARVRRASELASICYIRQRGQHGLGHAVLSARELVGDEPFAVFLPDDVFDAPVPVMAQMLEVYRRYGESVIAVRQVPPEDTTRYGIIRHQEVAERVYRVQDVVEKPGPRDAPSDLAIMGRYILTPAVFEALERTSPGGGGEVQLTDGLRLLLERQQIYAYRLEGDYYDGGKPLGLLKAQVALGLGHPEMGAEFREYLRGVIGRA